MKQTHWHHAWALVCRRRCAVVAHAIAFGNKNNENNKNDDNDDNDDNDENNQNNENNENKKIIIV